MARPVCMITGVGPGTGTTLGKGRRVPGIVRAADSGLRAHELYAYYYDRVDQPAVAHESE